MECHTVICSEALWMGLEKIYELRFGWFGDGNFFGKKFHLLPHAAANDGVVAVKPRRPACAVEDLIADVVFDQAIQFLLARRSPPSLREAIPKIGDPRGGNNDLLGRFSASLCDESIDSEQYRAKHEELE